MDILIFGSSGFIGGWLAQAALSAGWQVTAPPRSACDISDGEQVECLLEAARPEVVFNPAALANVDRAEREREAAYAVNVNGAANVARACARRKIRLVHYSTDAVFDGSRVPIGEDDPPTPLNYYGYTKSAGDAAVLREHPGAAILRVSLALGLPLNPGSNSFLGMLQDRLARGIEVFAPADEVRTPVDIHSLCAASLELAGSDLAGIYNIGAFESIDRYTLTLRLVEKMGLPVELVRQAGPPVAGRAPRHRLGILDVSRIRRALTTPMLSIEATIEQAVLM